MKTVKQIAELMKQLLVEHPEWDGVRFTAYDNGENIVVEFEAVEREEDNSNVN